MIACFLPLVVVAYWWTASSSTNPYTWRGDFYNLLADAFLHGQVSLRELPSPELLQLRNPYDPRQNEPYRLHDAALYQGRYYVYHGPTPALTLFAPWQMVTGRPMPQNVALVVYAFAAFVFSALLWFELCSAAGVAVPPWLAVAGVWSLAFCQPALFLLRRPAFYETAIVAGACFLLAAFWLLLAALRRNRAALFVAAGACFGLAAGARPHMIIPAAVAILLVAMYVLRGRLTWGRAAALVTPIGLSCLALAAYNYVRFGNPFEFGIAYLLSGSADTRGVRLGGANLIPGIYFLVFHSPALTHEFPFVYLTAKPRVPITLPPKFFAEGIAGCIAAFPAVALAFIAPLLVRRRIVVAVTASAIALVLFVAITGWATERYEGDFSGLLVVLALVATSMLWNRLRRPVPRAAFAAAFLATVCYATLVQAGISIAGPEDTMRRGNPAGFAHLRLMFQHEPGLLVDPAFSIEAAFTFSDEPTGAREPVLCTGKGSFGYLIFAEFVAPGRIRFASSIPGIGGATGPEVAMAPGQPFLLKITYDRQAHRLTMTHDSAVVFSHEFVMMPTLPGDITIGENRVADWIALASFRGSVRVVSKVIE